jgi:hypothetical protein
VRLRLCLCVRLRLFSLAFPLVKSLLQLVEAVVRPALG